MGRKVIIMAPTEKEVADAHFNSTDPDMAAGWTESMMGSCLESPEYGAQLQEVQDPKFSGKPNGIDVVVHLHKSELIKDI